MFELIKKIEIERKEAKKFPTFALYLDLIERSGKSFAEVQKELRQLIDEGKIKHGRTINDFYFYICTENLNK